MQSGWESHVGGGTANGRNCLDWISDSKKVYHKNWKRTPWHHHHHVTPPTSMSRHGPGTHSKIASNVKWCRETCARDFGGLPYLQKNIKARSKCRYLYLKEIISSSMLVPAGDCNQQPEMKMEPLQTLVWAEAVQWDPRTIVAYYTKWILPSNIAVTHNIPFWFLITH